MYHDTYQVSVEVYHDTYCIVDQERYTALTDTGIYFMILILSNTLDTIYSPTSHIKSTKHGLHRPVYVFEQSYISMFLFSPSVSCFWKGVLSWLNTRLDNITNCYLFLQQLAIQQRHSSSYNTSTGKDSPGVIRA